jgi:hypothetical protein
MKVFLLLVFFAAFPEAKAETYLRTNNGDIKLSAVREYLTRSIYGYYYGKAEDLGYKHYNERARREIKGIRIKENMLSLPDPYQTEEGYKFYTYDTFEVSFRFRNKDEYCILHVYHREKSSGGYFTECSERIEKIMPGGVHDIMADRLYRNYRR